MPCAPASIDLGVLRSSGHEHLSGSIVVPVITPTGAVTELYGRKVGQHLRAGTPGPPLPARSRTMGCGTRRASRGGEVILCESLIDALTFYCAGFPHVTASYGTAGFTADHAEAFERQRVARVLIAYDHDAAGDEAAKSAGRRAHGAAASSASASSSPTARRQRRGRCGRQSRPTPSAGLVRAAEWMGAGRRTRRQAAPAGPGDAERDQGDSAESEVADQGDVAVTGGTNRGDVAEEPPLLQLLSLPFPRRQPRRRSPTTSWCLEMGSRRWRVRHIPKAPSPGSLRVNVMVGAGERFHVDTVDLYSAKAARRLRRGRGRELRAERDALKAELGQVLLATEDAQAAVVVPLEGDGVAPDDERRTRGRARRCSTSPDLVERVADAFATLGVVGERTAALTAWLTLTSRLSDRPLGAVIQSSSSAGKSTLADAALALMPKEATVAYSAMTGQALYYLGETDLAHKVLSIAEEEGAARASYALKLLVSEGRLSIAAAGKDPLTGRLVTNTYEVTGPVALLMTTTSAELDDELANRLLGPRRRRGAPPDPGRPRRPARRRDTRGSGRPPGAGRGDRTARQRPAAAEPGRRGEPARPGPRLLGPLDAPPAGQRQVPRPHPGRHLGPPTPARAPTRSASRASWSPTSRPPTPTWRSPSRLCAQVLGTTTDELSPATRNLLSAIVDFATTNGEPIHPAGTARRHGARRQPAESPPGPPGRPRVRRRRAGRALDHLRAGRRRRPRRRTRLRLRSAG